MGTRGLSLFLGLVGFFVGLTAAAEEPIAGANGLRIVIEKKAHRMLVYSGGKELARYKISIGRGGLGKKTREGDKLTPEGSYVIDRRNPKSGYHRAMHISYPNKEDLAAAAKAGVAPGGDIMIHGLRNGFGWIGKLHRLVDWTLGCVALTNSEIDDLWALIPDGTPVDILP